MYFQNHEIYQADTVVIGAGVIGLAVAAALAGKQAAGGYVGRERPDIWLLEKESLIGSITSSRNSEVIHAGIYYPQGSLKARLCVQGKHRLYEFCKQHDVPHRRCGKVIVATQPCDEEKLAGIQARARLNGVCDLEFLDRGALQQSEPDLKAVAGLSSPSTGIVDSHALMQVLLAKFEALGGNLVLNTPVQRLAQSGRGWSLSLGGVHPCRLQCRQVINCAGLDARKLLQGLTRADGHDFGSLHYAKGCYMAYQGRVPFRRLVYPVPEPGGLGIHLTLDMGGQARFGPDVQWIEQPEYSLPDTLGEKFFQAIRQYWPTVDPERLVPAYAGVRPKVNGEHGSSADFQVEGPSSHGLANLFNLIGIESPGLTSSLALADYVCSLAEEESA